MTLSIDSNTLRYIYERLVGNRCGITYTADNRMAVTKLPLGHNTDRDALNHREKAFYDCFEGFGVVTREEMAKAFNNIMKYIDTLVATGKIPQITPTESASCSLPAMVGASKPAPTHSEYTVFAHGVPVGNGAGVTFFAPGMRLSPGEKLVSAMISSDTSASTAYSVVVTERTTDVHRTIYTYAPDAAVPNSGDTISRDVPVDYTVGEQPALFVILVTPQPQNKDGHPLELAMQLVVRRPVAAAQVAAE